MKKSIISRQLKQAEVNTIVCLLNKLTRLDPLSYLVGFRRFLRHWSLAWLSLILKFHAFFGFKTAYSLRGARHLSIAMNHIYGSPFPTINPKVRYRTALERAGFDVNFGLVGPDGGNGMELDARPESGSVGQSRVNSGAVKSQVPSLNQYGPVPGYNYPAVRQGSRQFANITPTSETFVPSKKFAQQAASSVPSPRSRTPSNPPFWAAKNTVEQEEDMNPIERSFMMLTQNDSSSNRGTVHSAEGMPDLTYRESVDASLKRESIAYGQQSTPRPETAYSTVESLNFEPSSELHAGLLSPREEHDIDQSKRSSSVPALTVKTRIEEEASIRETPHESFQQKSLEQRDDREEKPLISDRQSMRWSRASKRFSTSSRDVETPQTATNLQVRELLAQLENVSCEKNAQLDTSMLAATATNSLTGSLLDVKSLSVDRSRSCSNTSAGFKKSSAYLSQLPGDDCDITAQSLTHDEESLRGEDSPLFYNFTKSRNDGFALMQERPQIIIERSQLSHKETIENPKDVAQTELSKQRSNPGDSNETTSDVPEETTPLEPPVHKHPPGEGPCRTCGEEVNGKRIFSKGANELSGQWHRECFRCLTCDVRFNKRIPCYILDDQPYCQQHYHEKNGSICQVCQGFIEGECLENDRTERFHVHCLTCFLCKTRITSDYFIYNAELPLCSEHDIEALLRDGLAGEAPIDGQDNTVSKRRTRLITLGQK